MRTLIKIAIFLVIVVVAGLIAIPFFIDPNDYKDQISEAVEDATGRQLTLNGDIELSVFPWVALELGPLSLSNAKGFKAQQFAKIDATEVRIKLMPLLKKQLVMDTIIFDGLTLNLEKNKAGKTNWDDLVNNSKTTKNDNTSTDADSSKPALTSINIEGVKFTNATVNWTDASTSQHYNITNFNLITGSLTPGKSSTIDMEFDFASIKPQVKAHISLDSDVMLDLGKQLYSLTGVNFTINAEGDSLPFPKTDITLRSDIVADMEKQTVTLSQLAIQVQDLLVNGDIKANKILSNSPQITGSLMVNPFNLRQLANKLAIELPAMADSSTLELVKLTTDFTASDKQFNAKNLEIALDQTKLTGQLGVTNFADPAITFKLVLDEIDLDRYMPPVKAKTQKTETKPAATAKAGDDKLPLEALRKINAKGTFDIGKLKISGTRSEEIHLEINAHKGLIKLAPLSASMYQGQYKGNVGLDARGKSLKLSLNESLKGVQVGPLLKDLNGSDKLSGTANAQAQLVGNGTTVDQIKNTLTGKGNFSFTDGSIKGVNIAESIRKAKAALQGQKITSTAPVQTDFSSLTGSFVAKNGVINNQDLLVKSPLLRIDGAGKINLPKEAIDYGLKVAIVGAITGQGGEDLAQLKGLTIPVKITGSFDNPKPTVDMASILKDKATQEIKGKVADKLKNKLDGKLGGKLGDLVGGALGKDKPVDSPKATDNKSTTKDKPAEPAKSVEDQAKDALKDKLKSLF
ncbi:MAG: AsmA family protein [Gammaproteobacteria bacterium]|nr:AsmA family protein [Gammaproteobacteria bacterium]